MLDGVLIQEEYLGEDLSLRPWRVIVCSILCQRTSGGRVRPVLDELFARWPTPAAMAHAGDELEAVLRPTGFRNQRARNLRELSGALAGWLDYTKAARPYPPPAFVAELRGCGPYAVEAYRFVVLEDRSFRPEDKELRKAWNRDRGFGVQRAV